LERKLTAILSADVQGCSLIRLGRTNTVRFPSRLRALATTLTTNGPWAGLPLEDNTQSSNGIDEIGRRNLHTGYDAVDPCARLTYDTAHRAGGATAPTG